MLAFEARGDAFDFGAGVDPSNMDGQKPAAAVLQDFSLAIGANRDEQIRMQEAVESEVFGRDADDGVQLARDSQGFAEVGRGAMGEHYGVGVIRGKRPAEFCVDAQDLEIIRRHCEGETDLRRLACGDGNQALGDHGRGFTEIFEVGIGDEAERLAFGRGEDARDFVRARDRQRAQQDGIDDARKGRG